MLVRIVNYKLYPYEIVLLKKEIKSIGGKLPRSVQQGKIIDIGKVNFTEARKLTFVDKVFFKDRHFDTFQNIREKINGAGRAKKIQSKRYGPHGLHEYKGRFNPQTPRSLLKSNFSDKDVILDPFMGSGTTLVEARGLGIRAYGIEINPFAHLISIAKKYYEEISAFPTVKIPGGSLTNRIEKARLDYLRNWFPEDRLSDLIRILTHINRFPEKKQTVLKILLSDLLRKHSLQNPADLRIRRRDSVDEKATLLEDYLQRCFSEQKKHKKWINKKSITKITPLYPLLGDSTHATKLIRSKIDGTVSSPPYFSALPYIDTYRLSMIALGLITPSQITDYERRLIGARDIAKQDKDEFRLRINILPSNIQKVVFHLLNDTQHNPDAGFRKKAVPYILAKYCLSILSVLNNIYQLEKNHSRNLWVLGPNRTKLREGWFVIPTPKLVAELAECVGFKKVSLTRTETYPRYQLHKANSINNEYIVSFIK